MGHSTKFDAVDKQVLYDLVEAGLVDSDLLIRTVQLMAMPEFSEFFYDLCSIDLNDIGGSATVLSDCAKTLARPDQAATR